MKVILYNSNAEDIRVNKEDQLNAILTLNGTLRSASSVINPVIDFEIQDYITVAESNGIDVVNTELDDIIYLLTQRIIGCNYVYIEEFNRYYFVSDITSINNHLWRISMSVDVLMTYKENIAEMTAMVSRNQYEYDELIADDRYPIKTNCVSEEYKIEMNDSRYINFAPESEIEYNVIVTTFVSTTRTVDTRTPTIDSTVLNPVNLSNIPSDFQYQTMLMSKSNLLKLQDYVIQESNYASGIVSTILVPFNLIQLPIIQQTNLVIFDHIFDDILGIENLYLYGNIRMFPIASFKLEGKYNNFLDYNPYSQYEIYIPYKGWVTLDPVNCLNKQLLVSYALSTEDGSSMVFITDETSGKLIYGDTCQLGISIPFTTTNKQALADQRLTATTNMVLGTIGAGVGMISGNPLAIAGGVMGITKNIAGLSTTLATQHDTAHCSIIGGEIGQYAPQDVRLRITHPIKTLSDDDNYLATQGKPLNQTRLLKDVSGYTELTNFHLDNFSNATTSEKTSIENLLRAGVIL